MSNRTEMLTVGGGSVFASVAAVMEVPLPADATVAVLFTIVFNAASCFPDGLQNAGVLIDDVRVERASEHLKVRAGSDIHA